MFLYRGFTDSELARKGLLSPHDFHNVDIDFDRLWSQRTMEVQKDGSIMNTSKVYDVEEKTVSGSDDFGMSTGESIDSSKDSECYEHVPAIVREATSVEEDNTQDERLESGEQSKPETVETSQMVEVADGENELEEFETPPLFDEDEDDEDSVLQSLEYAGFTEKPRESDYELLSDEELEYLDTFGRQIEFDDDEDYIENEKDAEAYRVLMETLGVIQEGARDTLPGKKKKHYKRRPYY